jgi:hypothetical protein
VVQSIYRVRVVGTGTQSGPSDGNTVVQSDDLVAVQTCLLIAIILATYSHLSQYSLLVHVGFRVPTTRSTPNAEKLTKSFRRQPNIKRKPAQAAPPRSMVCFVATVLCHSSNNCHRSVIVEHVKWNRCQGNDWSVLSILRRSS